MFCEYYQAIVNIPSTWFVGGVFRNEDNLVFERTMDGCSDRLEFFVTAACEPEFLELMHYLIETGYVVSCEKKENRIKVEMKQSKNSLQ